MQPKLIKDLGRCYKVGTQTKDHHGLFECPKCKETMFSAMRNNEARNKHCKPCSVSISKNATKHGQHKTKIYKLWLNINRRCYDKNSTRYSDWGGRGITVCNEWQDNFENFKEWCLNNEYSEKLTLDRIDNNGHYAPNNCRFTDKSTQGANKRKYKSNTSGYIGIYKNGAGYYFEISYKNNTYRETKFKTKLDAVKARDKYIEFNNLPHTLNLV